MKMEGYNPQLAARVWKRVQGTAPAEPDSMPIDELIALEWADSQRCLLLSRRYRGHTRQLLQRIGMQKQQHVQYLKGIGRLQTGKIPKVPRPPVTPEPLPAVCRRIEQCARQYQQRCADPQWGSYFSGLAEHSRQHSHLLISVLAEP